MVDLAQALEQRRPVVCGTAKKFVRSSTKERAEQCLVHNNHAYSVLSVDPAAMTVSLRDAYGTVYINRLSMEDFYLLYSVYSIGPKQ